MDVPRSIMQGIRRYDLASMSQEVDKLDYNSDRDHRSTYSDTGSSRQGGAYVIAPSSVVAAAAIQHASADVIDFCQWEGLISYCRYMGDRDKADDVDCDSMESLPAQNLRCG